MDRLPFTLRKRAWVALPSIVMLLVLLQGYVACRSFGQREGELIGKIIAAEARLLATRIALNDPSLADTNGDIPVSPGIRGWLILTGDREYLLGVPGYLRGLREGLYVLDDDEGRTVYVFATSTPRGRLFVEYDASDPRLLSPRWRRCAWIGLVLGLVAVALTALITRRLTSACSHRLFFSGIAIASIAWSCPSIAAEDLEYVAEHLPEAAANHRIAASARSSVRPCWNR